MIIVKSWYRDPFIQIYNLHIYRFMVVLVRKWKAEMFKVYKYFKHYFFIKIDFVSAFNHLIAIL